MVWRASELRMLRAKLLDAQMIRAGAAAAWGGDAGSRLFVEECERLEQRIETLENDDG